jgi:hypothetical protein
VASFVSNFAADRLFGVAQQRAAAVINPSALELLIIATPSPLTLRCLEVEKTFHGASLMQINMATIYS